VRRSKVFEASICEPLQPRLFTPLFSRELKASSLVVKLCCKGKGHGAIQKTRLSEYGDEIFLEVTGALSGREEYED